MITLLKTLFFGSFMENYRFSNSFSGFLYSSFLLSTWKVLFTILKIKNYIYFIIVFIVLSWCILQRVKNLSKHQNMGMMCNFSLDCTVQWNEHWTSQETLTIQPFICYNLEILSLLQAFHKSFQLDPTSYDESKPILLKLSNDCWP